VDAIQGRGGWCWSEIGGCKWHAWEGTSRPPKRPVGLLCAAVGLC